MDSTDCANRAVVPSDCDVGVRFVTGVGGNRDDAVVGAQRPAGVLGRLATLLRVRDGRRDPFGSDTTDMRP
ncbi:hypothetical protein GCM10022255_114740 [Dactylosporangium darangshiense]|uniref:Uncharacterized protein n=1 Tax=Dactylosporangium darangshiense TaxID=579108 RepID=A0ABP8DVX8_9ACTN